MTSCISRYLASVLFPHPDLATNDYIRENILIDFIQFPFDPAKLIRNVFVIAELQPIHDSGYVRLVRDEFGPNQN